MYLKLAIIIEKINLILKNGDWGLGIGDWEIGRAHV